jgi:hypothetical protein
MSDKNLIMLKPGDTIATLHYISGMEDDDEIELFEIDEFTVTKDTAFDEIDMGDGEFILMFEMVDARNNSMYSDIVVITVDGDDIYIE